MIMILLTISMLLTYFIADHIVSKVPAEDPELIEVSDTLDAAMARIVAIQAGYPDVSTMKEFKNWDDTFKVRYPHISHPLTVIEKIEESNREVARQILEVQEIISRREAELGLSHPVTVEYV